jgi:stage II sporulation protein AA (anti-sigma F factor antagonist)
MRLSLLPSDDGITRIQCEGTVSQRDFEPGSDPLEELLGADCFQRSILLNMEKTHYIDSSGVGWLMGRHKQFLKAGGRLILYDIPPMVSQVLNLLRMGLILHMASDEASAVALAKGEKS